MTEFNLKTKDSSNLHMSLLSENVKLIISSKRNFDSLIIEEIKALKNNNQILAYELHSKINQIPKTYELDRIRIDTSTVTMLTQKRVDSLLINFQSAISGCSPLLISFWPNKSADSITFIWNFDGALVDSSNSIFTDSTNQ